MLKRLIYLCTGVSLACLLIWGVTTNLQAFVGESSRVVNSNGNTPKLIQITTASHVNRESRNPVINSDGTKIVFRSDSDLLGEGIGENQDEIWLYDGVSMTYTRITTASHSDRDSRRPAINGDGSKIVFESDSDLQGEGIGENQDQIWLYDTVTMAYIRITTSSHSGRESSDPDINHDGSKIVFESDSDLLSEGIGENQEQIWLYDTAAMTYTRITTSSHSDRNSTDAALNHAGTKIVFSSDSDLLGEGIGSGQEQIWLYDTAAMTYTRITTSSHSNRASWDPAINGDGSKVVFTSDSDLLGEGIGDNQFQVWLYDTAAMTYTRITTSSHSDRYSLDPTIDTSGTKILFRSDSDLLGEGVASKTFHIWLYDTTTMTYTRITTLPDGFEESVGISISQDGTKITFGSNAYLLGGGTGLGPRQIWLWDVAHYVYLPVTVK